MVINGRPILRAKLDGDAIIITHVDGRKITFNGKTIRGRLEQSAQGISEENTRKEPLKFSGQDGSFAVDLFVYSANGHTDTDTETGEIGSINMWLAWSD